MYFDEMKKDILANKLNNEQLFQKYFIDKETYFFKTNDNEYLMKEDIAKILEIHINDIYIVGSAKLGCSIKPNNEGRLFDGNYQKTKKMKDRSDIDVGIVSNQLFDKIQENIYDWSNGFKTTWTVNSYNKDPTKFKVPLKYKFLEYLGKGWYRPDLAPDDFTVETDSGNIKEVIKVWSKTVNRKIAFALYKNWHFFKKYQLENIENLRIKIKKGDV